MKSSKTDKAIVFYHYFEMNKTYRDNLVYFLSAAYVKSIDFVIVISGECSVDLPQRDNISYLFTENKNHDFGGYGFALSHFKKLNNYNYFIFVNSSVRGPFLPPFYEDTWTDLFTSKLSDDVHLVGSSINILQNTSNLAIRFEEKYPYPKPYSHVQTTAYALSYEAIIHLQNIGFYQVSEKLEYDDLVCEYELRLSQEIKRKGWNINCFLAHYNEIDYRKFHTDFNFSSHAGDMLYDGAYFGRTAHPMEIIFIKTNRNMISSLDLSSHTYCSLLLASNPLQENWKECTKLIDRIFEELEIAAALIKRK